MKLVTVSQMRAIEKEADAAGVSYAQMMENAGHGLAEIVHALGQENGWDVITGLVGSGNNGGDALVALTWLAEVGWRTHAYLLNRDLEDPLIVRYLGAGGDVLQVSNDPDLNSLRDVLRESDVLLDGLLGTGVNLPLKAEAAFVLAGAQSLLSKMDAPPFVVAVDCPSGVDCDSGAAAEEAISADLTVTMAAVKQGLLKLPAFGLVGGLEVVDIGLPDALEIWAGLKTEVADWEQVSALLPERSPASHKGTFGTAFVIAGSTSYTGAALLAGEAAYRAGAGLVTMAVPALLHGVLAGHIPEAVWVTLPHENGFLSSHAAEIVLENLGRATAVLVGPGIGRHSSTRLFIEKLLPSIPVSLVVDADGLWHLGASILSLEKGFAIRSPAVLTPHPGEMSVLTGLSREEIQENREAIAEQYARIWGHVVVLKGAFTVIAAPDGRRTTIPVATPALARAGTGDVLAGLIAGLCAQGVDSFDAAVAGAFIHAQSGLVAAEALGTTASVLARDVLKAIPNVLANLK